MYLGKITKCDQRIEADLSTIESKLVTDQELTPELPHHASTDHNSTCETIFTGSPESI